MVCSNVPGAVLMQVLPAQGENVLKNGSASRHVEVAGHNCQTPVLHRNTAAGCCNGAKVRVQNDKALPHWLFEDIG